MQTTQMYLGILTCICSVDTSAINVIIHTFFVVSTVSINPKKEPILGSLLRYRNWYIWKYSKAVSLTERPNIYQSVWKNQEKSHFYKAKARKIELNCEWKCLFLILHWSVNWWKTCCLMDQRSKKCIESRLHVESKATLVATERWLGNSLNTTLQQITFSG